MNNIKQTYPINDIHECLQVAEACSRERRSDQRAIRSAFDALAGDRDTGKLAFAIWRGRSRLLANIKSTN